MVKRSANSQARYRLEEQTLALYEQLVNDDNDERALAVLAESVTGDSLPELKHALREALGNVGDLERAYQLCKDAVAKNGTSSVLHMQLGELAVALDRMAEACEHFERAQTLGEESADLYQLWGGCEVALQNKAHATELFGVALELQPDRVSEVYSAWGKALCDAGELPQAKIKLEVAVAADHTAFYPHAYLGVVLLRTGDKPLAEKEFRQALDLIPAGHEAYAAWITLELSNALQNRGATDDALQVVVYGLRHGRRSMALFEKLRQLQGFTLGPRAKHFVIVVAGEDGDGDYYEECEVDADNEDTALGFIRAVHQPDEAAHLIGADVKVSGKPQGPFAGVIDVSDKTRLPEASTSAPKEDGIDDDDEDEGR